MHRVLERMRGGLVVSCQPVDGGPLDRPDIVARLALAALAGGAAGLRIEGAANLRAVREVTDAPVIGLVKSGRPGTEVRITSSSEDVDALAGEGADVIAFDATGRPRPEPLECIAERIRARGKLAMADCSEASDGAAAAALGCEVLGSTMSGYVGPEAPEEPDLELVRSLAGHGRFVVAEGRYNSPDLAAQAVGAGADAVVVGSAITRPEHVASWFAEAVRKAAGDRVDGG